MRQRAAMNLLSVWPAALLAACAPTAHTIEPYASNPNRASQLEVQARAICEGAPESRREAPKPFITDGCSMWPDRKWSQCCVAHDVQYWCGGSAGDRKLADQELRSCLQQESPSWLATLGYWGVRFGGHPIFPVHYRWGFGRRYLPWYDSRGAPRTTGAPPHPPPTPEEG